MDQHPRDASATASHPNGSSSQPDQSVKDNPVQATQSKGRVLIVDNHDLLRAGAASLLSQKWSVVGEAASALEALAIARATKPDLVLSDLAIPAVNGLELTPLLLADRPNTCVIIFGEHVTREQIRHAFKIGAKAFVSKQTASTELGHALEAVKLGGYYVTPSLEVPELVGKQGHYIAENPADFMLGSALTLRQMEVLRLIAAGKTVKQIASALNISTKTVDFHRNSIADELGVRTTAELTRYAIKNGIALPD